MLRLAAVHVRRALSQAAAPAVVSNPDNVLRLAAAHVPRALFQQAAPAVARGFASAPTDEDGDEDEDDYEIIPPLRLYGVSGRYATALFSAALREDCLDTVASELNEVVSDMKQSPDIASYLMDPTVPKLEKSVILTDFLKDAEYSEQTVNFMGVMAENGRMDELYKVADDFKKLVRAEYGQVTATITTAQPLKSTQIEQVKKAVSRLLKPEETLEVDLKVDPEILGGLIVAIEDTRIDMSVATRVKRMNHAIRTAFS